MSDHRATVTTIMIVDPVIGDPVIVDLVIVGLVIVGPVIVAQAIGDPVIGDLQTAVHPILERAGSVAADLGVRGSGVAASVVALAARNSARRDVQWPARPAVHQRVRLTPKADMKRSTRVLPAWSTRSMQFCMSCTPCELNNISRWPSAALACRLARRSRRPTFVAAPIASLSATCNEPPRGAMARTRGVMVRRTVRA
jgi:hypothetical protein